MKDGLITIGYVTSSWGHKGDIKVYPLTDFPERFEGISRVVWEKDDHLIQLEVEHTRQHKGLIFMKVAGINDPDSAEKLKDGYIRVPLEDRVPLPDGHYYLSEIVGLEVFLPDGTRIGHIVDILRTGSNDVYVVARESQKDLLLPALKSVIQEINLTGGRMIVVIPDGLDQ